MDFKLLGNTVRDVLLYFPDSTFLLNRSLHSRRFSNIKINADQQSVCKMFLRSEWTQHFSPLILSESLNFESLAI